MAASAASGIALAVGVLLVCAGVLKLGGLEQFAASLRTLVPAAGRARRTTLVAAAGIAVLEIATGAALPFATGGAALVVDGAAVGLAAAFVLAVARAIALGTGCSCFGRLGRTRAGGRELGRAEALGVAALAVLTLRLATAGAAPFAEPALVILGAVAAVLAIAGAMRLGEELGRHASPGASPRGLAGRAAELIGRDNGIFAARAAAAGPARPAPPEELASLLDLIRDSAAVRTLLDHSAQAGCRPPRWEAAQAAHIPSRRASGAPALVVSIPTEPGCTLTGFAPATPGEEPIVIACHEGRCAFVREGRLIAGEPAPATAN